MNEDASGDVLALQHQIRLLKVMHGKFQIYFFVPYNIHPKLNKWPSIRKSLLSSSVNMSPDRYHSLLIFLEVMLVMVVCMTRMIMMPITEAL